MLSLFRYLSVTSVTMFGNWDSSSARFARRRTLGKTWKSVRNFQRLGKTYIFWHILHIRGRSEIVNFAPKNSEAYESKQIQGVALP